jgi:hypothetical protein
MMLLKSYGSALAVVLALAGTTVAVGETRAARAHCGLRAAGLKAYWSVLRQDQKEPAKQLLVDHLAATAPDRMAAAARIMQYRADVAGTLTGDQRREAAAVLRAVGKLPEARRRALLDGILDGMDRASLADRVASLEGAAPEGKVDIVTGILDEVLAAVEVRLAEKLSLTGEQRRSIVALREQLVRDLRPVAVRLAGAREETKRKALALLDDGQRAELESRARDIRERVLAFIRG